MTSSTKIMRNVGTMCLGYGHVNVKLNLFLMLCSNSSEFIECACDQVVRHILLGFSEKSSFILSIDINLK
jgi:hypothetical protein